MGYFDQKKRVFRDFFKSYGSYPKTFIMFFVVLCKVVSSPKAIFDISTPDQENRNFRLQNEAYFEYFRMICSAKYSKNVLWILRWPESRPKCQKNVSNTSESVFGIQRKYFQAPNNFLEDFVVNYRCRFFVSKSIDSFKLLVLTNSLNESMDLDTKKRHL